MTRFVIFTTQRSGSTVLTRTLDEHPEIFCAGELFHETKDIHHPEWHFSFLNFSEKNKTLRKIDKIINYPNLRLRSIPHIKKFYNAADATEKARGFKLMFSHIRTAPYIWKFLQDENVKVIVLIRKNIFKTALSRFRKTETRVPHTNQTTEAGTTFHVSAQQLLKQLHYLEKVNKQLLKFSEEMERIIIYYEDFEHWDNILQNIYKFLEVKAVELKPVLNKVSAKDWRDEVENYDEIVQVMKVNNYSNYMN